MSFIFFYSGFGGENKVVQLVRVHLHEIEWKRFQAWNKTKYR